MREDTILRVLMEYNGLGHSYNHRLTKAGVVKINGQVVLQPDAAVEEGDVIDVGRHERFTW